MNVLNRILGGKQKSNSSDSPKETLWQKASSLRQSLRGRPRPRRPASLYLGDGSPPGKGRLRREWGSHRDLSREKRHATKSWNANNPDDDGGFRSRHRGPGHGEEGGGPKAWPSTSTLPEDQPPRTSGRSLRKLTKDSGYETSVQGEPDYVNRDCWTDAERDSVPAGAAPDLRATLQGEGRRPSHYKEAESSVPDTPVKSAAPPPGDSADGGRTRASSSTSLDRQASQTSGTPYIARLPQQDQDMGARRFRKGSVYQVLASRSGLDFAPLVHQARPWVDGTRETSTDRPERIWSTPQNSENRAESPTPPSSPPTPPARSTSSHEKYPSWPVTSLGETTPSSTSSTHRSHSWTQETDYPKEKSSGYVRPKKSFKISPHQLQPVLEKANEKRASPVVEYTPTRVEDVFPNDVANALTSCRSPSEDVQVHSPPERDSSAESYLNKYDDVLRHYQRWNDAPLLQRLYQEGERQGWPYTSSATSGTAGSQEATKWHGSYSDLSALSVQISNRSSLFDSGHSTLPDSGRLSPQSSCDGSVTTLSQTEAGHRVVSRLASQAVVAHSARVMQPKRHESESVLYYSTGGGSGSRSTEAAGSSAGRVSKLRATFDPLSGSRVSMSSSAASDETSGERLLFLDPYKKQRVSDPELKAIQKQAVLSFYKRQTSQQEPLTPANKNRSLPRHGLPNKFSVPTNSEASWPSGKISESPRLSSASHSPAGKDRASSATSWSSSRSWSVPDLAQSLTLACSTTSESARPRDVTCLPATSRASEEASNKASGPSSLPVVLRTEEERVVSGWSEEQPSRTSDGNASQTASGEAMGQRGRRAQLREVPGSTTAVKLITAEGVTVASAPAKSEDDGSEPPAVPPRRGGPADLRPPPRPPPKGSTPANEADDPELKEIAETSALNNSNTVPSNRCPLPGQPLQHLTSPERGSACSSPELPLPPPPPPAEPCDDPLPPPPEDLAAADNSTVYPKESYMCYRSERQRSRVEGSYRRGYQSGSPVPQATEDPVVVNNNNINATSQPRGKQQPVWSEGCVTPEDDLHNNNHLGGRLSHSWTQTCVSENHKVSSKSPEELECERLSHDLLACFGDAALRSLLVPSPDHKTVSDYMEGLVDMSDRQGNRSGLCPTATPPRDENRSDDGTPPNSAYFTTSEKVVTRYGQDVDDCEIDRKKEELAGSISRKLEALRAEQVDLRQEMAQNEALGLVVTQRVEALARPNELEKYKLHVEELEKIVHLLLSLSGRLARVHNALGSGAHGGGNSVGEDERRALEAKREKLSSQHEEARRLKESIDRRSQQVSLLLRRYLTPDECADYDRFVRVKSKLLVDARKLDEKIQLGEEQLAALKANGVSGVRSTS